MTLLFTFPEQSALETSLLKNSNYEKGQWEWRRFPDGESYVQLQCDVKGKTAVILCSLNKQDEKILPLIFLARTLKELGAKKITLIAPYLGYLRQDKRFKPGEAITAFHFADLLTNYIDGLITIDPHLHRIKRLEEIYDCECKVLTAAHLMAQWIIAHVKNSLVIGPDIESEQWVKVVAEQAKAPYVVLTKTRQGDHDVVIDLPDLKRYSNHTPVLVDDIISTATTMIKTIRLLREKDYSHVVCLATHGVFAEGAYENLVGLGNVQIVTTNTLRHSSNDIDVSSLLIDSV